MLQFGAQDNVSKTGTKRLCTINSIIKTLRLSGQNVEADYQNLIHKQAICRRATRGQMGGGHYCPFLKIEKNPLILGKKALKVSIFETNIPLKM